MDKGSCQTCRFVDIKLHANMSTKEAARKFAEVFCRRYPRTLRVSDDHWCGEFSTQPETSDHG